ncbi:MAG: trifunctional transcriptional activator/DNA repair protein Ada/methylated-DNA--[protein]-cysteine S-methyltransferase [Acidobacteria bacterium]|nr:trifunctional transcriptional activator/DNA repair protein Ada/methylated-DNA--[protein]-cysteine S-methyltransferase [Acidobacteriota bacterium]
MINTDLPSRNEMMAAFLQRDSSYDGIFVTAVKTTGIFCRTTCPARKPRPENVEFFPTARDALLAGYRPCLRCRPMQAAGKAPAWVAGLLADVELEPARRWTDADLRDRNLNPDRVRRWFQQQHGMTFHAYYRARRLGLALGRIRQGDEVTAAAFDHGYDSLSGFNEAFHRLFGAPASQARESILLTVTRILTPLGPMLAAATEQALYLLEFADRRMLETQIATLRRRLNCTVLPGDNAVLEQVNNELASYFGGELTEFTVPIEYPGTEFQCKVWEVLKGIPAGLTMTYGEVAREVRNGSAVRAVGRAVGDNRLAIVIPCHRVVGANGRLTGYGGHLWRKKALLEHEREAWTRNGGR